MLALDDRAIAPRLVRGDFSEHGQESNSRKLDQHQQDTQRGAEDCRLESTIRRHADGKLLHRGDIG